MLSLTKENKLKKIVITGVSSSLMVKFVSLIDLKSYEVLGISRNPENIELEGVRMVKGDILNEDSISHYFDGCDILIHAAAITHSFIEKEYYKVNFEGTKNMVTISKKFHINKFIFISSNTAGTDSGSYGVSKLLAEDYIKKHLKKWSIFRLSEVFGGSKKEGIDALIHKVLSKKIVFCPLEIPTDFFPIYINDAARLLQVYGLNESLCNNTIIINGTERFSFLEIINLVKSISGKSIKIYFIKRKWMFVIKKIAKLCPFYIGVKPDQIERLYSEKKVVINENTYHLSLESYVKKISG